MIKITTLLPEMGNSLEVRGRTDPSEGSTGKIIKPYPVVVYEDYGGVLEMVGSDFSVREWSLHDIGGQRTGREGSLRLVERNKDVSRWSQIWNLRVKLVLLLAFLLAGTLAVQGWLEERKRLALVEAVEQIAADIAAEAAEMMIHATAAIPLPGEQVKISFLPGSSSLGGRNLQIDEQSSKMLTRLNALLMRQVEESSETSDSTDEVTLNYQHAQIEDLMFALIIKGHPEFAYESQLASDFILHNQPSAMNQYRSSGVIGATELKKNVVLETTLAQREFSFPVLNKVRKNISGLNRRIMYIWTEDSEEALGDDLALGRGSSEDKSQEKSNFYGARMAAPATGVDERARETGDEEADVYEKTVAVAPESYGARDSSLGDPDQVRSKGIQLQVHLDRLQKLVNKARTDDLVATISVYLVGLILAWILGIRLMKPMTEVVYRMHSVSEGDLSVRLPERSDPEFGPLNRQFNDMVLRIEDARRIERSLEHRERVQTMGDLAAGVAHDIRNPLSAISLHVGRIRRDFIPEDTESKERFLNFTGDVKEEIERLDCLVGDFLQLAQPAAHQSERVNPGELLEDVHRLLKKEAAVRNVVLEIDVQKELGEAIWNRIEAKSAFLNIAMNAMQAMEEEGGFLKMSVASDKQWIVISFVDDGPGIPEEDLQRVLLPYVTMRPGGTGLGLAIARRVAERHGGRLELDSELGVGTEVRFLLPTEDGGTA